MNNLTIEQESFINNLTRCLIFEVARVNFLDSLFDDGSFRDWKDYKDM